MQKVLRTDFIKPFQGTHGDNMQDTEVEMMDAISESISVTMCCPRKDATTQSSNPGGNCEQAVTPEQAATPEQAQAVTPEH